MSRFFYAFYLLTVRIICVESRYGTNSGLFLTLLLPGMVQALAYSGNTIKQPV